MSDNENTESLSTPFVGKYLFIDPITWETIDQSSNANSNSNSNANSNYLYNNGSSFASSCARADADAGENPSLHDQEDRTEEMDSHGKKLAAMKASLGGTRREQRHVFTTRLGGTLREERHPFQCYTNGEPNQLSDKVGKLLFVNPMTGDPTEDSIAFEDKTITSASKGSSVEALTVTETPTATTATKEAEESCIYKLDDAYYVSSGKYSLKARLFRLGNSKMLMMSTTTDEVAVPLSKLLSIVKITRKDDTLTMYSSFKKWYVSGCTLDMFVTLTDSLNADKVWEDDEDEDDEDDDDEEDDEDDEDEEDDEDDEEEEKLTVISFLQKLLFGDGDRF